MKQLLLCTDLDRTLLPNGLQAESPAALPLFKKLVAEPFVTLAYVSGRDLGLLEQAIRDYDLPRPDFMIGDVGTTIYRRSNSGWQDWQEWQTIIGSDWQGVGREQLAALLVDLEPLSLQEEEKQGRFKLSFYTKPDVDPETLKEKVRSRLQSCPAKVSLVHSIDEVKRLGLFDVLPAGATKLHGVRFLMKNLQIPPTRVVFAGDSGNDLEILTSGLPAVLVANATAEVKKEAARGAPPGSLYIARGNFMHMNGNYAAGILEGLTFFLPELSSLLGGQPGQPENR